MSNHVLCTFVFTSKISKVEETASAQSEKSALSACTVKPVLSKRSRDIPKSLA